MLPTIWESVSFPPADPYCALGLLIWSLAGAPVVGFRPQSPLLASFWSVSLDVAEMIRAGVPSALKQRMSHEPKLLLELCTGGVGGAPQGAPRGGPPMRNTLIRRTFSSLPTSARAAARQWAAGVVTSHSGASLKAITRR